MELHEIVFKLIGNLGIVNGQKTGELKAENTKMICDLTNKLIIAIDDISYDNKNYIDIERVKDSIDIADKFLKQYIKE